MPCLRQTQSPIASCWPPAAPINDQSLELETAIHRHGWKGPNARCFELRFNPRGTFSLLPAATARSQLWRGRRPRLAALKERPGAVRTCFPSHGEQLVAGGSTTAFALRFHPEGKGNEGRCWNEVRATSKASFGCVRGRWPRRSPPSARIAFEGRGTPISQIAPRLETHPDCPALTISPTIIIVGLSMAPFPSTPGNLLWFFGHLEAMRKSRRKSTTVPAGYRPSRQDQ